jgi:hypothetical protein
LKFINSFETVLFTIKKDTCEDKAIEHYRNDKFDIEEKTKSFENYYTELKILGEVI